MEYIYVGHIFNTHGLKGEVKVSTHFKYKDDVFKKDFPVYLNDDKEKLIINNVRTQPTNLLITFKNINNIDDVLKYKGSDIYILRSDLKIDGYLEEDILNFDVYMDNKKIGVLKDYTSNSVQLIMVIESVSNHKYLVPYLDNFIENVDLDKKRIDIINMEGLIDED